MSLMDRLERPATRFYDAMRSSKARDENATASGFRHLAGNKYALLVTYKRSGEAVPTPVWFGLDDTGRFYTRTGKLAGKVKRIRNNPRVLVAPCTVRGKPRGPAIEGRARVLPQSECEHAERTIQANYSGFRRVYKKSAGSMDAFYIEVSPVT